MISMVEVQMYRGDHCIDWAEAEDAESAVRCALELARDDMNAMHNAFPGRMYQARFFVDGQLVRTAPYSTLFQAAS